MILAQMVKSGIWETTEKGDGVQMEIHSWVLKALFSF